MCKAVYRPMSSTMPPPPSDLADAFRDFVRDAAFPCVGAKSALARDQMTIVVARDITSGWDDMRIWPALYDLAQGYRAEIGRASCRERVCMSV